MSQGKYLSLPEARKEKRLNLFAKHHSQFEEQPDAQERFDALLQGMAQKPTSKPGTSNQGSDED